jgi:hypothetical protein
MKAWISKFRISSGYDEESLPKRLATSKELSEDVRQFGESSGRLDRALRNTQGLIQTPDSLHGSIMRAVRVGGVHPADGVSFALGPQAAAAAVLVLALIFLALAPSHRQSAVTKILTPPLSLPVAALELGEQVTQAAPETVLSPLTQEWQRLNLDLDKTGQFLLSSLP